MPKVILGSCEVSRYPEFAGSTWVWLQYMLGLERMGVECFWVDHLGAVDPLKDAHSLQYMLDRFAQTAREFGIQARCCVDYNEGQDYFGMSRREFEQLAGSADLLLNPGGHLLPESPLTQVPRRAYVDVDPGFTQIWSHGADMGFQRHNLFFTVGQNVGRPDFKIPTDGIEWRQILPPVALEWWPACINDGCQRFSTVADWRGSQQAAFQGEHYGGKREEFLRFLSVPSQAKQRIEIALCIGQHDYEDLGVLDRHNWRVREPLWYAGDPQSYREFIRYSRAEFSLAKNGYVKSNSGWVSDRTACYLASGKPALVQSTGFEWRLPTGRGLITFRTVEEAVAGIEAINSDYLSHCQAAREIAEEYFNSEIVLGSILKQAGL